MTNDVLSFIEKNIAEIRKRIEHAAGESGREPADIEIVAVTKTVEPPLINKAIKCGIYELGENRVQELLLKHGNTDEGSAVNWHMIGHLQTNKVRQIMGRVSLIHSVDSAKLADEINRRAIERGIVQDVLVEVNMSGELSKFGLSGEKTLELIRLLWEMRAIRVKGLMTVAPYVEEGEKNRDLFKKMRNLFVDINDKRDDNEPMTLLSMGMTGDFEAAVLEGANLIRIGTGIFGRRD